jgi:hypothetical protein
MNFKLAKIIPENDKNDTLLGYWILPLEKPMKIKEFPETSGLYFYENIIYFQDFQEKDIINSSWELVNPLKKTRYSFELIYELTLLKNIKEYVEYNYLELDFLNDYKKIDYKNKSYFYINRNPMKIYLENLPDLSKKLRYEGFNYKKMINFIKKFQNNYFFSSDKKEDVV